MSILKQKPKPIAVTQSYPLSISQSRIKVKAGDKWFLPGVTGTGKTTFAKELERNLANLYPTSRIYILDSKFQGDFDDYPGRIMQDSAPRKPKSNERYQVWQPVLEVPEEIEKWLWQVRHDPPAILFIDELVTLCYSPRNTSDEYSRIQKLGRALPIGTITLTQELVNIPRNAIGQATHIVRFRLALPYEKTLIDSLMRTHVEEPEHDFGFYYARTNKGSPQYYASMQEFFKLSGEV